MQQTNTVELLRTRGYRITRQRVVILEAIQEQQQHFTAEELHEIVRASIPTIDLATIYRSLHWLHEFGLVRKFNVGTDRLEWEDATAHAHHHLICRSCGAQQQIDNHVIECLNDHILHHYGFEADPDHLAIWGRCAACRVADDERRTTDEGPQTIHNAIDHSEP